MRTDHAGRVTKTKFVDLFDDAVVNIFISKPQYYIFSSNVIQAKRFSSEVSDVFKSLSQRRQFFSQAITEVSNPKRFYKISTKNATNEVNRGNSFQRQLTFTLTLKSFQMVTKLYYYEGLREEWARQRHN